MIFCRGDAEENFLNWFCHDARPAPQNFSTPLFIARERRKSDGPDEDGEDDGRFNHGEFRADAAPRAAREWKENVWVLFLHETFGDEHVWLFVVLLRIVNAGDPKEDDGLLGEQKSRGWNNVRTTFQID